MTTSPGEALWTAEEEDVKNRLEEGAEKVEKSLIRFGGTPGVEVPTRLIGSQRGWKWFPRGSSRGQRVR